MFVLCICFSVGLFLKMAGFYFLKCYNFNVYRDVVSRKLEWVNDVYAKQSSNKNAYKFKDCLVMFFISYMLFFLGLVWFVFFLFLLSLISIS